MFNPAEPRPTDLWIEELVRDDLKLAEFFHRYRFAQPPQCATCNGMCTLHRLTNRRDISRQRLPVIWRCSTPNCNGTRPFLFGSYLQGTHLSLQMHIRLMYKFYRKRNAKEASEELGVGHKTVIGWFAFYRRCIHRFMQMNFYPNFRFSANSAIAWDEACFVKKQKHHRGNVNVHNREKWVLGGEQEMWCAMKHVRNREARSLEAFIVPLSPIGAVQVTDGWRGYLGLNAAGFVHFTVNHERGFVDPLTGHHTNSIEGLWALLRGFLRRFRGVTEENLKFYLDDFAFRRNMRLTDGGLFIKMMVVIGTSSRLVPTP